MLQHPALSWFRGDGNFRLIHVRGEGSKRPGSLVHRLKPWGEKSKGLGEMKLDSDALVKICGESETAMGMNGNRRDSSRAAQHRST